MKQRSKLNLNQKIEILSKFFDLSQIINIQPDLQYIQKYYQANRLAYSVFHTFSNRMYMGISRDGKYKSSDLLEAARVVESYISKTHAIHILELATGRGATSAYLAKKFPDIQFNGLDLSMGQLHYAYKEGKRLRNYRPSQGDYHDLSQYQDGSMDIVFEIEALCYSQHKEVVFKEIKRVLKPSGVCILLDGYATKNRSSYTELEKTVMAITEKSMALPEFEQYDQVMQKAQAQGLQIMEDEDVSTFILPTLYRFESLAAFFFNLPLITKVIVRLSPLEFSANAAAGFLFPDIIKNKLGSYHITVLRGE